MSDQNDINRIPKRYLLIAACCILMIWGLNFVYALKADPSHRGTFGDTFGIVNALFSGCALLGLTYAIFQQNLTLKLTKKELKATQQILDEQKEQLKIQNEDQKKQAFENTFFQLLRIFTETTNEIDLLNYQNKTTTSGKDVFLIFLNRLRKTVPKENRLYGDLNFNEVYEKFYLENGTELGHYFRLFYNILKFVDRADITNKDFYTDILRAQLSSAEVAIIFYNGISNYGCEKLKPLLEKYHMLKHINDADIIILHDNDKANGQVPFKDRYEASAFDLPS